MLCVVSFDIDTPININTIEQIMRFCISAINAIRIAKIMQQLGFEKTRGRDNGAKKICWVRKTPEHELDF